MQQDIHKYQLVLEVAEDSVKQQEEKQAEGLASLRKVWEEK